MLKKSNDFRFLLEDTSFLRPASADRNSRPDSRPCKGDSGSGLVKYDLETDEYTLIGIVSFGLLKCKDNFKSKLLKVTFFTKVSHYLSWIVGIQKNSTSLY